MKTNLLLAITLFLGAALLSARAQDFRALPPAEQPNAAELAYLDGRNPNFPASNVSDTARVRLVVDFLNDLINAQFEVAHGRIADDFRAYGPGFYDFLETDDLLAQWERNGRLFKDQQLTIETTKLVTVPEGDRRGQWVFVKAVWSAQDNRQPGQLIRTPFYELAHVRDNKIQRTYTSYGNDQLFYDLGFPLYSGSPMLRRAEVTQKR